MHAWNTIMYFNLINAPCYFLENGKEDIFYEYQCLKFQKYNMEQLKDE